MRGFDEIVPAVCVKRYNAIQRLSVCVRACVCQSTAHTFGTACASASANPPRNATNPSPENAQRPSRRARADSPNTRCRPAESTRRPHSDQTPGRPREARDMMSIRTQTFTHISKQIGKTMRETNSKEFGEEKSKTKFRPRKNLLVRIGETKNLCNQIVVSVAKKICFG